MGAGGIALTLRWPWIVLPALGAVRVSTILTAVAVVAIVLWRRRSPLLALIAVMAWASTYEVAFNALGAALHGWSVAYLVWLVAALAGWIVLAFVKGVRPERWLAIAAAAVAIVWVAFGFDANSPTAAGPGFTPSFSLAAEAFNEVTKTLLGAAYLVGALRAP